MDSRGGDIGGWIGASLGSICWILVLAGILLARAQVVSGGIGLLLFGIAAVVCFAAAPWRNPDTPYWKLMLAMYATPAVAIAWAIWLFGARKLGLTPLAVLTLLWAVLFPVWQLGQRRWNNVDPSGPVQPAPSEPPEKHT